MNMTLLCRTALISTLFCSCTSSNTPGDETPSSDAEGALEYVVSLGPANVGMCSESDSSVEMRFVLLNQRAKVIRYNDKLDNVPVVNESSLTSDQVTLTDGKLYSTTPPVMVRCPSPEERIRLNIDETDPNGINVCLAVGGDRCEAYDPAIDNIGLTWDAGSDVYFCRRSCASDAECAGGTCATSAETGLQYCTFDIHTGECASAADCPAGFGCEPVSGDGSNSFCTLDTQEIATAPGSVELVTPDPSGGETNWVVAMVMDNSGSIDGRGVVEDDSILVRDRATDRGSFRISAMQQFLSLLDDTESRPWAETMAFGLWSFRGESATGVRPLTGDISVPNPYGFDKEVVRTALSDLQRDTQFGRSPVFLALQTVADSFAALAAVQNRQKAIILFTDGPDDSETIIPGASDADRQRALDARQAKLDGALQALQAQEVQVFIVHLDTAIGPKGLAALQPDPANAKPFPRDGNGRFGPIDEYAQIACATNGQYIYVPSPERLSRVMEVMAEMFGGTWGVNVGIAPLEQTQFENAPYRLGSVLEVELGGDRAQYFFSPLGNNSAAVVGSNDNRPAVFKRQGGAPRANTNLGGTVENTTINLPPEASE